MPGLDSLLNSQNETIVTMDLTCSICSDGRVLDKPLDEYRPRPGGGNKKNKENKE